MMVQSEVVADSTWSDRRLIMAHDPVRAAGEMLARDQKTAAHEQEAERLASKFDRQDDGAKVGGRKLTGSG